MSRKHHICVAAVALAAFTSAPSVAHADPPSDHPLATPIAQPDGYQPQLSTSSGSASHPDNFVRPRPQTGPGLSPAVTASKGFDWADGAVGAAAGAVLMLLAVMALVAVRSRGSVATHVRA